MLTIPLDDFAPLGGLERPCARLETRLLGCGRAGQSVVVVGAGPCVLRRVFVGRVVSCATTVLVPTLPTGGGGTAQIKARSASRQFSSLLFLIN